MEISNLQRASTPPLPKRLLVESEDGETFMSKRISTLYHVMHLNFQPRTIKKQATELTYLNYEW